MNFQQPHRAPDLHNEIRHWLGRNPSWYLRPLEASEDDQFPIFCTIPYRYATASEVADDIVSDPALHEVLAFLASPPGQAIEQAIAQIWLPAWSAQLLTEGLTQAWKMVLDQNRPLWQRADVLAGAGLVITAIGIAIWADRNAA